jgi:Phthiocerol/phthiodiolone dimycocerosyl transferase C-terminus
MVTRRIYRQASPTEMIYIATGTIVVSRSSIAGAVSREQFDRAVACLEARYGILRSVVEDGQFMERVGDRSAVEAWLPPDMCSLDAVYATLLNARLDPRVGVYAIHVIAHDDALDVFMLSSHAITDATSLIELHSCLAHFCDCVVRGVVPALDEQPFPSPVDAAVSHSLALLPAGLINDPPPYSGAFSEIPVRAPHDGGSLSHCLDRVVINADDVHRIGTASHAHGSSVHSLLLAAFALAIRDVAEGRPPQILMRSSVDMRRRLEPHVSAELVFSAITGHITLIPDLDRPLFDIAKLVFSDIHEGVANGRIFHDYLNYPKAFGNAQQPPVALNVSDMQAVKFHWPMERLKVTGFEYALGWLKRYPNVSVSVYDGTLVANTVYVQEFANPMTMRAVSERAVDILLSACQFQ